MQTGKVHALSSTFAGSADCRESWGEEKLGHDTMSEI